MTYSDTEPVKKAPVMLNWTRHEKEKCINGLMYTAPISDRSRVHVNYSFDGKFNNFVIKVIKDGRMILYEWTIIYDSPGDKELTLEQINDIVIDDIHSAIYREMMKWQNFKEEFDRSLEMPVKNGGAL